MKQQPVHKVGFLEFMAEYPPDDHFDNCAEELNWILENIRYRRKRIPKTFVANITGVTISAVESWLKPYRGACRADLGRKMPDRSLRLFKLELGLVEPFWQLTGGEAAWNVRNADLEKPLPDELKVSGLE